MINRLIPQFFLRPSADSPISNGGQVQRQQYLLSALALGLVLGGGVVLVSGAIANPAGAATPTFGADLDADLNPDLTVAGSLDGNVDIAEPKGGRIRFVPPKDARPATTAGAGSRGRVRFAPPAEGAPATTAGAGSRGRIRFAPPGDRAPMTTAGAGSRGRVRFAPRGEDAPATTAGAGSRGRVRFAPPGDAAPAHTVGSGSREESLEDDALALLPPGSYTQTRSDRPSLMLYLPSTRANRAFVSVTGLGSEFHYQTEVTLTEDNGILEVSLPEEVPGLAIGQDYLWQVVFLAPEETLAPDTPVLRTIMTRVASSEVRATVLNGDEVSPAIALDEAVNLAQAGLWTDTLQVLADARRRNPGNTELEQEWTDLLTQVGLEDIADAPLLAAKPLIQTDVTAGQ